MTFLDWLLIAIYFLLALGIALYYYKRASKSTSEFFLGGRNMPWWLVGTSMVATTFAADTPLAVTEFVADSGIAGNWIWWNFALGGMLTVFFFARLWRRSGIQTDVEFVEVRYAGKPAAWLRGIKAIYFGLVMNVLIIGWVALAMETIVEVLFPDLTIFGQTSFSLLGIECSAALIITSLLIFVAAIYALLAGLWGVAVTDAFQFTIAMTGSIVMAVLVLKHPAIGGIAGLQAKLPPEAFQFFPSLGDVASSASTMVLTIPAFVAFIGIQWWSSWYPGSEPGGGGYVAQRMMSAKDERHSLFATLYFTIAHYCLRPWPWILVALSSLVLYPNLVDTREGFVLIMRDVLPAGLLGLLVAAFLAAFMSTISTQLNWGVSYLINDFWRRFLQKDRTERHYVLISRLLTAGLALLSILVATQLESISEAWHLILTASAGLGLVLILRWYWWRINAWSELVATLLPILMVLLALFGVPVPGMDTPFPQNLFTVVAITTAAWLLVTFVTRTTDASVLDTFYRKVRPAGPGWKPLAKRHTDVQPDTPLRKLAVDFIAGVLLVYTSLFATGYLILGNTMAFLLCLTLTLLSSFFLWWSLRNTGHARLPE